MGIIDAPSEGEMAYLDAIDRAVKQAADVIDLVGVPDEDEDPEEWNAAFERVSHCGTCTVREVMNVVWPSIERYIDWVRTQPAQTPRPPSGPPERSMHGMGVAVDALQADDARTHPETLMSLHQRGEFG